MRITIIKDDGVVGIDGVFRNIDLSSLAPEIRAVQWSDDNGHVEFYGDLANVSITDLSPYQQYIDDWRNVPEQFPQLPELDPRELMVVSRFQALAAMFNFGILPQVEAYFSNGSTSDIEKLAWKNAVEFYRLSPLVVNSGVALGLNDTQLDDLFAAAALITV